MRSTSNKRKHQALRWVVGVGLAFALVVGCSLQVAWRRALERWDSVVLHWEEEIQPRLLYRRQRGLGPEQFGVRLRWWPEAHGGTVFRAWRQQTWGSNTDVVLRQERNFFGSTIEARMTSRMSEQVDQARPLFAAIGVPLLVEP